MIKIILLLNFISFATFAQADHSNAVFEGAVEMVPSYADSKETFVQQEKDTLAVSDHSALDEFPIAPGCNSATNKKECLIKYINLHISKYFRIPRSLVNQELNERIIIAFLVEKNGNVRIENISGEHQKIKNEIEGVMKKISKMTPGMVEGRPVSTQFSFPLLVRNY